MKAAKIWIENNPETGSIKPFEVFWQTEGYAVEKMASCATQEGAQKSLAKLIKRNRDWFHIEVAE